MIDRDSIRLSRIQQIHEKNTSEQVHSINGVPVYTTSTALKVVARDYMAGERMSLRIISDVSVKASVRNGSALTYSGGFWIDSTAHLRVAAISINAELLSDSTVNIVSATTSKYGTVIIAQSDSVSTDRVATPVILKNMFNVTISGGFTVVTNIPNATWWLDDDNTHVYTSGTIVRFLTGEHVVHFSDIPGYVTPAPKTITINGGTYQAVSGFYTSDLKKVTCILGDTIGSWSYDGVSWYSSGQTVEVPPGEYTLSFTNTSGQQVSNQRLVVTDHDVKVVVGYK